MRTVDLDDYAREGMQVTDNLSIGFETPIMVKTGEFPPALEAPRYDSPAVDPLC